MMILLLKLDHPVSLAIGTPSIFPSSVDMSPPNFLSNKSTLFLTVRPYSVSLFVSSTKTIEILVVG